MGRFFLFSMIVLHESYYFLKRILSGDSAGSEGVTSTKALTRVARCPQGGTAALPAHPQQQPTALLLRFVFIFADWKADGLGVFLCTSDGVRPCSPFVFVSCLLCASLKPHFPGPLLRTALLTAQSFQNLFSYYGSLGIMLIFLRVPLWFQF